MTKNSTTMLINKLNKASSVYSYLDKSGNDMAMQNMSEYLNDKLSEKGLTKREVFWKGNVDDIYGYQIFQGKKRPSFDVVVRLAFGLGLSFDETKVLLKSARLCALSPRIKRDAVIIYGLQHGVSLDAVNEQLYDLGEMLLGDKD